MWEKQTCIGSEGSVILFPSLAASGEHGSFPLIFIHVF